MNIQDAKQEIIRTILTYTAKNEWGGYAIPALRQRPLLLIGPPGIGKTAVMEQAARECEIGFVSYTMTHHTRQSAIGLPFIERKVFNGREYAITEYTMSEIIASVLRCIEETGCREGLLFLDEINCVSETLAPAMLQFLQTKTFGSHRLPEGWVLAAAGNPPEYNKSVREFDIATLDRLKYIEVEADYDAWRPYALEMNIHGSILSYLDSHRDSFYILKQTYSSKAFATARGWEDLSCVLWQYERLADETPSHSSDLHTDTEESASRDYGMQTFPVTPDFIHQYLHSEALAQDFAGYYQVYTARKKAFSVSALLRGEEPALASGRTILKGNSFDEKLVLVHLLLSGLGNELQSWKKSQARLQRIKDLLERLQRYQKQQKIADIRNAVPDFLQKEQEVLQVRKEHGLSSESELQAMQQLLYELQAYAYKCQADQSLNPGNPLEMEGLSESETGAPTPFDYEKIQQPSVLTWFHDENQVLETQTAQLLQMMNSAISFLASADGPEFTVFLSSLAQNPVAAAFFRNYPCTSFMQYKEQLNFRTREEELRKKLTQY